MYILLLRLSAPLQSWGSDSVYDNRETDYIPTKSGVLGMLAAALGIRRGEPLEARIDGKLFPLADLKFGVRVDFQGTKQNDFQITQMGEKRNANLANKAYLSDAIFLVGLGHENRKLLEELEYTLKHPIFSLFLGRRSCPPTQPLVLGIRDKELYQSLLEEEWLLPLWRREKLFRFSKEAYLRIVMDGKQEGQGKAIKRDVPLSFSPFKREYGYRYLKEMTGTMQTEHDPMLEMGD